MCSYTERWLHHCFWCLLPCPCLSHSSMPHPMRIHINEEDNWSSCMNTYVHLQWTIAKWTLLVCPSSLLLVWLHAGLVCCTSLIGPKMSDYGVTRCDLVVMYVCLFNCPSTPLCTGAQLSRSVSTAAGSLLHYAAWIFACTQCQMSLDRAACLKSTHYPLECQAWYRVLVCHIMTISCLFNCWIVSKSAAPPKYRSCPCASCIWLLHPVHFCTLPDMVLTLCNLHWWCFSFHQLAQICPGMLTHESY